MTAPTTVRHFERLAGSYTQLRRTWPLALLQDQEARAVHALARVPVGARVLDAGCGAGQVLTWLRTRGAMAIGVDRARAMARECRRQQFLVSVQDMEALAFTATFDWVLCIGSLEFTTDPRAALRAFAGCLRPHGELVLLFPRRNWLGRLYRLYHRRHGTDIHLFSRDQMQDLLLGTGFQPREWQRAALSFVCRAQRGQAEPCGSPSC